MEKPTEEPQTTTTTDKIENKPKEHSKDGIAKIKKEFLMTNEKVGEKRKLDTTTKEEEEENSKEEEKEKKNFSKSEKTGQNQGRRKKNKILRSDYTEEELQKPLMENELNDISLDTIKALSKSKYKFTMHDEVLKKVNDYANDYNKFKQNIIKQLNHEVFPDMEDTKYRTKEIKKIDCKGKTVLAPLTTVGNLPFRKIQKKLFSKSSFFR